MPSAAPLLLAGVAAAALVFAQRREDAPQVLATKTTATRTVIARAGSKWALTAATNLPPAMVPELTKGLEARGDVELVSGPNIEDGHLSYVVRYLKHNRIDIGSRIQMGAYWIELIDASQLEAGPSA